MPAVFFQNRGRGMKYWDNLFVLEGESVKLQPISIQHFDGLWEAAKPEEIWTYMATKVRNQSRNGTNDSLGYRSSVIRDLSILLPSLIMKIGS